MGNSTKKYTDKNKKDVMDYFFSHYENSDKTIADALDFKLSFVQTTTSNHFKLKHQKTKK